MSQDDLQIIYDQQIHDALFNHPEPYTSDQEFLISLIDGGEITLNDLRDVDYRLYTDLRILESLKSSEYWSYETHNPHNWSRMARG